MIGFSLFSLTDISVTAEQVLMSILWIISVLGVCYYIFKIIGFQEWCKEIWNNIKDIKFFLVAIIAIIAIVLICQIIPKLLVIVPTLIGVGTVIELLSSGCQKYIVNKFNISKHLKENKCFFRLGIFLLLAPFIFLGLFPIIEIPNGIFSSSDVLGYYGSLVGGAVTVLGVYWTLNYESKKSKEDRKQELKNLIEERRRDSLPILRFKFLPEGFSPLDIKPENVVRIADPDSKLFKNYDIVLDTTDGSEKYSESSIHVYGDLIIKNVGLGVAIISDVKLIRTKPKYTEVKNTGTMELNNYLILTDDKKTDDEQTDDKASQTFRMSIRSDDLNENDTLQFTFMDLYSNEYFYNIPFRRIDFNYYLKKTKILEKDVEIIPNLVSTKN